jgi:hypothetical protein
MIRTPCPSGGCLRQHIYDRGGVDWVGQEEDRRKAREGGFDHHLVKPVDLEALQTLLTRVNAVSAAT